MSISLFKKHAQEPTLAEQLYARSQTAPEGPAAPVKKTVRQLKQESEKRNQERVLLPGRKQKPEWKVRKAVREGEQRSTHFTSQLERIHKKESRLKELEEVKQEARKQTLGKSKLAKGIHKAVMTRLLKK